MAAPDNGPVRIAKISGRYLVFDPELAAVLRRELNTCGSLVGTAAQQPTQNIFLGLPIELRPEEADALIERDLAYVVDDVAAHQAVLRSSDRQARHAYIESLRGRKLAAKRAFDDQSSRKSAEAAVKLGRQNRAGTVGTPDADTSTLLGRELGPSQHQADSRVKSLGVTPTSSRDLVPADAQFCSLQSSIARRPLCLYLQTAGCFMTPGLRFGSQYSVYPGDPLRFHAHFMANQYDWEEEISMLDLVGGGRLATAVKKAFLFGAEKLGSQRSSGQQLRVFSMEWAGM